MWATNAYCTSCVPYICRNVTQHRRESPPLPIATDRCLHGAGWIPTLPNRPWILIAVLRFHICLLNFFSLIFDSKQNLSTPALYLYPTHQLCKKCSLCLKGSDSLSALRAWGVYRRQSTQMHIVKCRKLTLAFHMCVHLPQGSALKEEASSRDIFAKSFPYGNALCPMSLTALIWQLEFEQCKAEAPSPDRVLSDTKKQSRGLYLCIQKLKALHLQEEQTCCH